MNRQAVFDVISGHLIQQNACSQSEGGECLYRNPEGLKCAIGALIQDDAYDEGIEGTTVAGLLEERPDALAHLGRITRADGVWLDNLQEIHDLKGPDSWRKELARFAKEYRLQFKEETTWQQQQNKIRSLLPSAPKKSAPSKEQPQLMEAGA